MNVAFRHLDIGVSHEALDLLNPHAVFPQASPESVPERVKGQSEKSSASACLRKSPSQSRFRQGLPVLSATGILSHAPMLDGQRANLGEKSEFQIDRVLLITFDEMSGELREAHPGEVLAEDFAEILVEVNGRMMFSGPRQVGVTNELREEGPLHLTILSM